MGKKHDGSRERARKAGSFPSPPSSSSSDFEFTVSLSPSSRRHHLCPADELFYKGQLLPLHLSPRISMVRTLFLSSSSASSSSTDTTTASRDSSGSSSSSSSVNPAELLLQLLPETDSSRPSSVVEEDTALARVRAVSSSRRGGGGGGKYLASLANRFSLVFRKKDPCLTTAAGIDLDYHIQTPPPPPPPPAGRRVNSSSAKQVIKKYVKKVRPLYEKLSPSQKSQSQSQNQNQQQQQKKKTFSFSIRKQREVTLTTCNIIETMKKLEEEEGGGGIRDIYGSHAHSHSFSGNLRFPRRKRCAGSCPSSMRSSPTHSGLLRAGGGGPGGLMSSSSSTMDELQSAIQGAIAHCKSTMIQSSNNNQKKVAAIVSA